MRIYGQKVFVVVVLLMLLTTPVDAQQTDALSQDTERVRQHLFNLIGAQEAMLQSYELLGGDAPHLHLAIKRERLIVRRLTTRDLQPLVDLNLPLDLLENELSIAVSDMAFQSNRFASQIENASGNKYPGPSTNAAPDPATAGAPHLGANCPANGLITPEESVSLAPGPCNQAEDIPTSYNDDDGTPTLAEYRLSDVDYPLICFFDTPAAAIVAYEITFNLLNYVLAVTKPACDQGVAGFNGSTACIPVVVGVELAEELLGQFKYCNGARRNTDGTAIYTRVGEIFVQSNAHYKALEERNVDTDKKLDRLESDVSAEVRLYGSEVSAELDAGFGDIDVKMDALEQQLLENQLRSDFTRLNNEEIVREIRIQKARILDDLLK